MHKTVYVKYDPIKCNVRFELGGKLVAEIKPIQMPSHDDDSVGVPVYEIIWHDVNSLLIIPGQYKITDVAMPILMSSMVQCIIDDYWFKNSPDSDSEPDETSVVAEFKEKIKVKYHYSDGAASQEPVFISNYTTEDDINDLPRYQLALSDIWSFYREERGGILDESFIDDLVDAELLQDFLCLINVHLSFNIASNSGGQKDE